MNKNKDIIWGVGFMVAIVASIAVLIISNGGRGGAGQTASLVISAQDWVKGNAESQVTLVEYSDFQCPACGAYQPLVKQLMQEFGDKIQFVYRHFPLSQIHANAEGAAFASEAAGKQGKFWEMHDLLFANQAVWSKSPIAGQLFEKYASELGIDLAQFKTDVRSSEVKGKVRNDYLSGVAFGIEGTPTFFLNGKKLENPRSYEQFKAIILNELDAQL